jgi:hypothetical protein
METAVVKLPEISREIRLPDTWIAKRARSLETASAIKKVQDQITFDAASEALQHITKTSGELENERKKFTRPFTAGAKAIKKMCDDARDVLEQEKRRLKQLLAVYASEQARKAAEERRRAEDEARREAERKFAEQQAEEDLFGESAATEKVIEVAPAPEPTIEEARSSSSRVIRRLVWQIEDAEEIPRAFLMVDDRKVNQYMRETKESMMKLLEDGKDGRTFIAGIRFEIKTDVAVR